MSTQINDYAQVAFSRRESLLLLRLFNHGDADWVSTADNALEVTAVMVKVVFIEHSGTRREVDAKAGRSVMQAAVSNGVPGIDADCGGSCSCATCHVFVDADWLDVVGGVNPTEDAMLSMSADRAENSRLSCQITVTEEMDGLTVTTPEFQY